MTGFEIFAKRAEDYPDVVALGRLRDGPQHDWLREHPGFPALLELVESQVDPAHRSGW